MKFQKLLQLIKEASGGTLERGNLTHLEHFEDLILFSEKGIDILIKTIELLLKKQEFKITLKIDGSPACIFGKDPLDNKFFVATKGAFAQTPTIGKTVEEINQIWSEKPGLRDKLIIALNYLSRLKIPNNIGYQGDILFSENDKHNTTINNKNYITFKANTLTYAISQESKEYNKVNQAKFGIAIHTKYNIIRDENESIKTQQIEVDKEIYKSPTTEIYIVDTDGFNIKIDLEDYVKQNLENTLKELKNNKSKIAKIFSKIDQKPIIKDRLKVFINKNLDMPDMGIFGYVNTRTPNHILKRAYVKFVEGFKQDLTIYFDKEIDKAKSEKGKNGKENQKQECLKILDDNKNDMLFIVETFYNLIITKTRIWEEIEKSNQSMKSFSDVYVKDESTGEYTPTQQEGFVIVTKDNNIKVVNRKEFSRLNRIISANRKKT